MTKWSIALSSHMAISLLIGFLCGAIPFGYLLFWLTDKRDIRDMGSGNIGASNVLRTKGLYYGLLIMLLDCGKGALPLFYVSQHFPQHRPLIAATLLAAVLGHIYTPFLKGKGGKGVATFLGALIVFSPYASLVFLTFFIITISLCRYVSAASVTAVTLAFMVVLFSQSAEVAMIILLTALMITVQHRKNIQRILNGEEARLGKELCHE